MSNETIDVQAKEEPPFEEVVENLLKIIDTYEIRQKVAIINRISESILQQEKEHTQKEKLFLSCFGSLETEETADELCEIIQNSRYYRRREVSL
ncbi:MAG: hypothetical protein AAF518_19840 [Spirochaetota bacterium]